LVSVKVVVPSMASWPAGRAGNALLALVIAVCAACWAA